MDDSSVYVIIKYDIFVRIFKVREKTHGSQLMAEGSQSI